MIVLDVIEGQQIGAEIARIHLLVSSARSFCFADRAADEEFVVGGPRGLEAAPKRSRKVPKWLYLGVMPEQPVAFGPFLLNPDQGTLFRDGALVAIGQKGALLLGALLKRPGQVVTKADLMDAAWPGTAVEESNLSVQIASLRKLLGASPGGGEWIATIPRVGYRLLTEPDATVSVPTQVARSEPVIPSLAMLPFQNLSGDPEQDYFADGVVEDIITALSRFKSFAVIARNSSFVYKGRAIDVRQVATDLGVRYVLEGSVRRVGTRIRISAQLVDGLSGLHLWARNFDGVVEDIFEFQDSITETVAAIVEPEINRAEIERSRRERPERIAAYDLYLRALRLFLPLSPHENAMAVDLLQEAIALEPENATFLAMAAALLEHRHGMGWPTFGPNEFALCADYTDRALKHASGDAFVLAFCGNTLIQCFRDYDRGMELARHAIDANPNMLYVVDMVGVAYLHCGDLGEALKFFHRALRLSPRDPGAQWPLTGIAHVYMARGKYEEALVWANKSLALNKSFGATYWMLIAANALLGRLDEARLHLKAYLEITPGVTIAAIREGQPAKDPSRMAAILEGLRIAGLEEG